MRRTVTWLLFGAVLALVPGEGAGQTDKRIQSVYTANLSKALVVGQLRSAVQVAEEDSQEAADRAGIGPTEPPIRLSEQLEIRGLADFGMQDLQEIAALSLEVYPDANLNSGVYYYRPRQYFLHWTPADQYYLSIDYKPEQASDKNVIVDARMTPGPVQDDRQVLERLLKTFLRRNPAHPQPPNIEQIVLLPLPARYEGQFNWTGYGVGGDDISVTGVDRDTRQFGIQIQTDVATKELLLGKLGDPSGLSGDVRIVPQAVSEEQPALAPFTVRARLKLADNEAYSRGTWRRGGGDFSTFVNEYKLPLTLRYLNYLIEDGGRLVLRGYDLQAQRLTPGSVAKVPNDKIHDQIGAATVVRAWYSHTLGNDAEYREAIIDALTGGVGAIPVTNVDLQIVRGAALFEQYDLFKIVVVVRSRFFDPNADSTDYIEKGYEFEAETGRLSLAPLYQPEGSSEPLYEFKIGLISNDGMPSQDGEWRLPASGFSNSIFIGSRQIEEVLAE